MGQICVVVDNQNLEPLLRHSAGASGSLRLTTVRSGQSRAVIEIKYTNGRRTTTLYTLSAEGLRGEKPPMEVTGRIDGRRLTLEFILRKKVFHRATVKLPGMVQRPWWVLPPAAMIAAACLLFLLPRGDKTAGEGVQEPRVIFKTTDTQSVSPSAAAPAVPPAPLPAAVTESETAAPVIPEPIFQTIYFLPDDSSLTTGAVRVLEGLITTLGNETGWRFEITGHCALAGTERGRIDLSRMRAEEVYSYLTDAGITSVAAPEIEGVGGSDPVTRNPDLQHLNRRVEITAFAVAHAVDGAAGSG